MNIEYSTKYSGYIVILRCIQYLLSRGVVNLIELSAYILFSMQADWDRKHKYYRAILKSDEEFSELWGCSYSKVHRLRKLLIKKGLLEENNGVSYIKNLDMFKVNTANILTKKSLPNVAIYYLKSEDELSKIMFNLSDKKDDEIKIS